ncbi:helix-turn-helix domain-containing protein [Nocardia salmonicida]|nr:helix-turn-helix domain-containing protein [Nocardia salmonicida]
MQAYRFALDPTPRQQRVLRSHCGASRFAFNHMLAFVKAVIDQRTAERSYGVSETELPRRSAGHYPDSAKSGISVSTSTSTRRGGRRLGETHLLMVGEQGCADSGSVPGRGAIRKSESAPAGCETSTPTQRELDSAGTASPQGAAA